MMNIYKKNIDKDRQIMTLADFNYFCIALHCIRYIACVVNELYH